MKEVITEIWIITGSGKVINEGGEIGYIFDLPRKKIQIGQGAGKSEP